MKAADRELEVYGHANSPEAYEIRDFLHRNAYPFSWHPIEADDVARLFAGAESSNLPICILPSGERLSSPSIHELATRLDWFRAPKFAEYDLAIYGAGPAGLSAAVYGASEGLRTLLIEMSAVGGQAGSTSRIENYLGFPEGISGWELASRAREQAQRMGAEILLTGKGIRGGPKNGWAVSYLASGEEIRARATICATGVHYNRLDLPEEDRFLNRGFFYGAGSSEANLCTGHVIVVGGGNSAGQAALYFSTRADRVTMVVRGDRLADTLSAYLYDRIGATKNITVLCKTDLVALEGDQMLERVSYRNSESGETTTVESNWVFVCIGGTPHTDWAEPGTLLTDASGYILTGDDLRDAELPQKFWSNGRRPLHMESSMPGLFAAGDVRHDSVKRCATAVGDGATAVSMIHKYLALPEEQKMSC
jgi:thioredoxin reductase (NADPH)